MDLLYTNLRKTVFPVTFSALNPIPKRVSSMFSINHFIGIAWLGNSLGPTSKTQTLQQKHNMNLDQFFIACGFYLGSYSVPLILLVVFCENSSSTHLVISAIALHIHTWKLNSLICCPLSSSTGAAEVKGLALGHHSGGNEGGASAVFLNFPNLDSSCRSRDGTSDLPPNNDTVVCRSLATP